MDFSELDVTIGDEFLIDFNFTSSILKGLKNRKSPGIDGIKNQALKNLPKHGIKAITSIINAALNCNSFLPAGRNLKQLQYPNITNLWTVHHHTDQLAYYHPSVIKDKLIYHIDENNILPNQQFGFRQQPNTLQPLFRIKNLIRTNFQQSLSTGMLLLDIQAAFHSVWHDSLIFKMIQCGFPPELTKIVQCFLTNRSFQVHIGSSCSSNVNIPADCPQRYCLSLILNNIFTSTYHVLRV